MEDVEEFLDNRSRRDVLKTSGAALTAGLTAGCLGGENGDEGTASNDTETERDPTETPPTTGSSSNTTDEAAGRYPQQESSGTLQANIDQNIKNGDGFIGLKVNIDDLSIEEFPNLVDQVNSADSLNELGDASQPLRYDRALYVASNMDDIPSGSPEDVYFRVYDPDVRDFNIISMYPNANDHGGRVTETELKKRGVAARRIAEDGSWTREYKVPLDESKPYQKEFLSETLSADDVVHAVNLEDTYVEDAIE